MDNSGKSALGLDTNVAAGLAWLWLCGIGLIMSIIILVTDKTNKFARFHAFQSLLAMGAAVVAYIVAAVIIGVAAASGSGMLAMLGSLIWFVLILAILGVWIFGAIQAFTGKMFKYPIIGDMADKWSN